MFCIKSAFLLSKTNKRKKNISPLILPGVPWLPTGAAKSSCEPSAPRALASFGTLQASGFWQKKQAPWAHALRFCQGLNLLCGWICVFCPFGLLKLVGESCWSRSEMSQAQGKPPPAYKPRGPLEKPQRPKEKSLKKHQLRAARLCSKNKHTQTKRRIKPTRKEWAKPNAKPTSSAEDNKTDIQKISKNKKLLTSFKPPSFYQTPKKREPLLWRLLAGLPAQMQRSPTAQHLPQWLFLKEVHLVEKPTKARERWKSSTIHRGRWWKVFFAMVLVGFLGVF